MSRHDWDADALRAELAEARAALAKVRHDCDEMIRVHDEVERDRDHWKAATERADAALAKAEEENARLRNEWANDRAALGDAVEERDNLQAALGRAVAALRATTTTLIDVGIAADADVIKKADAVVTDPTCAAAGEAWREGTLMLDWALDGRNPHFDVDGTGKCQTCFRTWKRGEAEQHFDDCRYAKGRRMVAARRGAAAPMCSICNDMHRMLIRDREVPCTHCPRPCRSCARDGGVGAYCSTTPCTCDCHAEARKVKP